MTYTEEQLRQVAVACFVNARDLYEDACLLGKDGGGTTHCLALPGLGA